MKLWGDGQVPEDVEAFTVGRDHLLDQRLVAHDCRASVSHVRMLVRIRLLSAEEGRLLEGELERISEAAQAGRFPISREAEDCHTAIERHLVSQLGDVGRKVHTGRSRNDQVLTALRLYYRDELNRMDDLVRALASRARAFARRHNRVPMPGYTHTRKAMPSTVGLWARALADALADDRTLLATALKLADQCPLGTGAGYGVPLPLDRRFVARDLGFSRVQQNPIYAQNSRGKLEAFLVHVLAQLMLDLNRAATDLIFFTMPEFGFFHLPDELCTGSSIMPQKVNPDVLELVRARYHTVLSHQLQLSTQTANLIYGYHRDLQATKEPTMAALDITRECLQVMDIVFLGLRVDRKACRRAMTRELFAVEEAYELVRRGVPFRTAYLEVKERLRAEETRKDG